MADISIWQKTGHFYFALTDLKLAIERYIVYPLANLFPTDQIHVGDLVRIDRHYNQTHVNFTREVKNLVPPARRLEALGGSVHSNVVNALSV
jgi:hypothetical protein